MSLRKLILFLPPFPLSLFFSHPSFSSLAFTLDDVGLTLLLLLPCFIERTQSWYNLVDARIDGDAHTVEGWSGTNLVKYKTIIELHVARLLTTYGDMSNPEESR